MYPYIYIYIYIYICTLCTPKKTDAWRSLNMIHFVGPCRARANGWSTPWNQAEARCGNSGSQFAPLVSALLERMCLERSELLGAWWPFCLSQRDPYIFLILSSGSNTFSSSSILLFGSMCAHQYLNLYYIWMLYLIVCLACTGWLIHGWRVLDGVRSGKTNWSTSWLIGPTHFVWMMERSWPCGWWRTETRSNCSFIFGPMTLSGQLAIGIIRNQFQQLYLVIFGYIWCIWCIYIYISPCQFPLQRCLPWGLYKMLWKPGFCKV